MKGIVVYGSRYGATKETAEEIAKILRTENFEIKVVNAKEEKVKDISEYALVTVGSGIACNKWVNEAEDFLKKSRKNYHTKN
jgi:menaquinone-dependent protoporphyrinogen IX oxidase